MAPVPAGSPVINYYLARVLQVLLNLIVVKRSVKLNSYIPVDLFEQASRGGKSIDRPRFGRVASSTCTAKPTLVVRSTVLLELTKVDFLKIGRRYAESIPSYRALAGLSKTGRKSS
eukprot:SAG11_NODE_690_length_7706_cov_7.429078_1_plen_116_part_00